jgi:hypothetical protein
MIDNMTLYNFSFFLLGAACALVSGIILAYWGISKKSLLWTSARTVYIFLAIIELYNSTIYFLVLFGCLQVTDYGVWVRPLAFVNYLAPLLIAIIHRKTRTKHDNF